MAKFWADLGRIQKNARKLSKTAENHQKKIGNHQKPSQNARKSHQKLENDLQNEESLLRTLILRHHQRQMKVNKLTKRKKN